MGYEKNVRMENYSPGWDLQILIGAFFAKMYILCFDWQKKLLKIQNSIFNQNMRYGISIEMQNRLFE